MSQDQKERSFQRPSAALAGESKSTVLSVLCERWRELAGFAVLFRLVESLLFAPAAGLVGKWLLGRTVLDSTAIISFVVSPRGFLAVALAAVLTLSIRLFEHA